MRTEVVMLKIEKSVNDANQSQPNVYSLVENGVVLFTTHSLAYALQAFLNRN